MKLNALATSLLTAGVVVAGSAGAIGWLKAEKVQVTQQAQPPATVLVAPSTTLPAATSGPIAPATVPNYRAIVQQYGPAVVGITTAGTSKASLGDVPEGIPEELIPFFRGAPRGMPRGDRLVNGQGSGFILSKDGIILTNAHVVKDANEVIVKLSDRREYKARLLGSDTETDIAVLKIDATDLPVVSLGNPAQLGVGDYVLAIGSPFGFEQSATAGIVSAKARSLPGDGSVPFIQTDVAVNPGNSGGPLFDSSGAVVGVNSQIYSRTGGYQGVSFSIPIDVALNVKDQIVATGKAVHARLGVTVQELSQSLAESFKLTRPDGALVSSVLAGSPAARAGLEPGDVILKFNNAAIGRSGDLPAMVSMTKPGSKATLDVWRAGKPVQLSATLAEAKELVAAADATPDKAPQGRLGVAVRPLTAGEKAESHLVSGLLVEQSTGAAARGGIEPGDVIVAVNGRSVETVEQLQAVLGKDAKHLALLIQRGDAKIFIPVKLG